MTDTATPVLLPSAGRYRIDPARPTIIVKVRHLFGLATVTATFALREADVTVGNTEAATVVHAVIDAASFASGNSERDRDIVSPKSLDTVANPHIAVEIRSVKPSDGSWTGLATITAHDAPDLNLKASARIDRYADGITAGKGMAGWWVTVTITATGTRQ